MEAAAWSGLYISEFIYNLIINKKKHNMSFTKEEIDEIKYAKRYGYIFSSAFIVFGATLLLLIYSFNRFIDFSDLNVIAIIISTIGLSYLILVGMNRKINKDLKSEKKLIETKIVEKKEKTIDYEVGSGSLYVPVLGKLFPKIWGQEMKSYEVLRLTIDGEKYNVGKDIFDNIKEGDNIELHWSYYGEIFLGIRLTK
ncbi:MAG: hypothetical protein H6Q18_586 [Bacteroidetes bacterium]|nr:hypothetical protein [Bacteroidota bacterium]